MELPQYEVVSDLVEHLSASVMSAYIRSWCRANNTECMEDVLWMVIVSSFGLRGNGVTCHGVSILRVAISYFSN